MANAIRIKLESAVEAAIIAVPGKLDALTLLLARLLDTADAEELRPLIDQLAASQAALLAATEAASVNPQPPKE